MSTEPLAHRVNIVGPMNEFHFRRSYRDVMNECRETNINNTHKRLNWAEPETSFDVPTQEIHSPKFMKHGDISAETR